MKAPGRKFLLAAGIMLMVFASGLFLLGVFNWLFGFVAAGVVNLLLSTWILLAGIFGIAWRNRPKRGLVLIILAAANLLLVPAAAFYATLSVPFTLIMASVNMALLILYISGAAINLRFDRWQPQAPAAPSGLKPFCNVCGAKNTDMIAYCHSCGNELKKSIRDA